MRIVFALLLSMSCLLGCSNSTNGMSDALALRESMIKGNGFKFRASVTADYGDRIYDFVMDCCAYSDGTVEFTVVEPETICGIKGRVSQSGGQLVFDNEVLLFEPLTSMQITPVIAPYLMVKSIQSGYIRYATDEAEINEITIDDSFRSKAFQTVLTLDKSRVPSMCEIFWNNRRIMSIQVTNFEAL